MEAHGLVTAELYQRKPKRFAYALTRRGAALVPVLQAICRFGCAELPDRWTPPDRFMRLKPSDIVRA